MSSRDDPRIPPRSRTAAAIEQELEKARQQLEDAQRAYRETPLTWPLGDTKAERAHDQTRRQVASWTRAIRDLSLRLEMARRRERERDARGRR